MAVYFGSAHLGELAIGSVDKSFIYTELQSPIIAFDANSGLVTASIMQTSTGYVYQSATTSTYQLSTVSANYVIPNDATQTLAIGGKYTLGDLVVNPVPTEVQTVTYSGVYYPTTGNYISSFVVDIPDGDEMYF